MRLILWKIPTSKNAKLNAKTMIVVNIEAVVATKHET